MLLTRLASCFIDVAAHVIHLRKCEGNRESASKVGVTVFGNLTIELSCHPFCFILLKKSKSLVPASAQEMYKYRSWRSLRAILEGCLP